MKLILLFPLLFSLNLCQPKTEVERLKAPCELAAVEDLSEDVLRILDPAEFRAARQALQYMIKAGIDKQEIRAISALPFGFDSWQAYALFLSDNYEAKANFYWQDYIMIRYYSEKSVPQALSELSKKTQSCFD